MSAKIITLCYRKIIDANAAKAWDKLVFEDSFMEFKLQAQTIGHGTNYTTYGQLVRHVPNAQRLAGLVTPAITSYVQQLGELMPDLLNNIGRRFIKISKFQLEIINSDINDKSKHQVAINFYSEPLVWHDTVASMLLLSPVQPGTDGLAIAGQEQAAHLFQLQPYVNIHTITSR